MSAAAPQKPKALKARAVKAGLWSLFQVMTTHVFRLGSNLIMTRLLFPEAFGMMSMAVVVLTAFQLLSDIGIRQSIMRAEDGETAHFLRAAWCVKISRGIWVAGCVLLAAAALWLLGPRYAPEGTVYADPRLAGLIALTALSPVIMGFESTAKELALRNLDMRRVTLVQFGGMVASISSMIGFAMIHPSVWALMLGMLVANLVQSVASHIVYPGPQMRFEPDRTVAKDLWAFGKYLMGSSALTFVARNADRLILGSLLSSVTFGLYAIAMVWIEAGKKLMQRLSNQVGFPVMSEVIRTRPEQLPQLFARFQRVIDMLALAAFATCALLGQWLIGMLYTDQYNDAGIYLSLLSLTFLMTRFEPMNQLVVNIGNSRAMMWISAIRAASLCAFLPLAFNMFGLKGAILVAALNPGISAPYVIYLLTPVLGRAQTRLAMVWLIGALGIAYMMARRIHIGA